jgi:hypothetical protein
LALLQIVAALHSWLSGRDVRASASLTSTTVAQLA